MNKFNIGDKVVKRNSIEDGDNPLVGEVIMTRPNDECIVQWDEDVESVQKLPAEALLTELEAKAFIAIQRAEQAKLDAEFEAVRAEVHDRLKLATAAVKDAIALCQQSNKDFHDLGQEIKPLFKALNEGGWRSSTIECS
jgi:hypothetical protein